MKVIAKLMTQWKRESC